MTPLIRKTLEALSTHAYHGTNAGRMAVHACQGAGI